MSLKRNVTFSWLGKVTSKIKIGASPLSASKIFVFALAIIAGFALFAGTLDMARAAFMDTSGTFQVTFVDLDGKPISSNEVIADTIADFDLNSDPVKQPLKEEYVFVRAFIDNGEELDKKTELTAARLSNDKTSVELTLSGSLDEERKHVTLSIPVAESKDKIKIQVYQEGTYADIAYQINDPYKNAILGAKRVALRNGAATFSVTTFTPRNEEPNLTADNDAIVEKLSDLSRSDTRIYQYKITTTRSTTLTLTTQSTEGTSYKAVFDYKWKADWMLQKFDENEWKDLDYKTYDGITYQHFDDLYVVNNKPLQVPWRGFEAQHTESVSQGDNLTFRIYRDRATTGVTAQTPQLASVYVNGTSYPAPQVFSRYGSSMYESWADAPGFENMSISFTGIGSFKYPYKVAYDLLRKRKPSEKWFIPTYTKAHGFSNPWQYHDPRSGQFKEWIKTSLQEMALDAFTLQTVENGPLAGSTIKITLIDVQPYNSQVELGSEESRRYNEMNYKQDNVNRNKFSGYGNSLRLCYEVQITNVNSDLTIDTEWVTSSNAKVGVYYNHGLDSMQIKAAAIGDSSALLKPTDISTYPYTEVIGKNHIDLRAFEGTKDDYENSVYNNDPVLDFKATVKNGYVDPRYIDATWFHEKSGKPYQSVFQRRSDKGEVVPYDASQISWDATTGKYYQPRLQVMKSTEGTANYVTGSYPIFTARRERIFNGDKPEEAVTIGGMSVVGVRAKAAQIGVFYDLDGGTAIKSDDYPNQAEIEGILDRTNNTSASDEWFSQTHRFNKLSDGQQAHANLRLYNVETRPVVVLPTSKVVKDLDSTKTKTPLTGWELLLLKVDNTIQPTGKIFQPGDSLDISNAETLTARLSSTQGDLSIKAVGFKANYSNIDTISAKTYTIKLVDQNTGTTLQEQAFKGVPGLEADLNEDSVPLELRVSSSDENGQDKVYVRKKRSINDSVHVLLSADNFSPFAYEYEEVKDIIAVPPYAGDTYKPTTHITVEYKTTNTMGRLADSDTTTWYVKKNAGITLADLMPKPTIIPVAGYTHTGWDKVDNTPILSEDITVNAQFKPSEPIISKDTNPHNPGEYVLVKFSIEESKGSLVGTKEWWIDPEASVTLKKLNVPTVKASIGYEFEGAWVKDDGSNMHDEEPIIQPLTLTAKMNNLPSIDTSLHTGYIALRFEANPSEAKLTGTTTYYINPNASITLSNPQIVRPNVTANTGYEFTGWDKDSENNQPITGDLTVTAEFTTLADIIAKDTTHTQAPSGYVTITFASGTQGSFEEDAATVFYVNPNKNKSYKDLKEHTPSAPLPTKLNTGYTFTHYTKEDGAVLTDDESLTTTQTFTAAYSYVGDVIAKDADHQTNPGGYVLVSFTADSDKGSVSGASEYWVNPNGNVSFGTDALKAPEVVANTGYSFSGSWLKDDNTVITTGTVITKALTLSADLTKLPNVTTEQQAGYVAVSFAASPSEKATLTGTTTYYVNPSAHVTLGNALIVKPEVTPHTGYSFNGTWSVGDETEITSPLTVLANLSELPNVVASPDGTDTNKPSGYVSISFSSGANGSFKDSRATTKFFVNPDKALTFDAQEIAKPEVIANTGYAFRSWTYKEGDETKDATSALILTKDYMVEADYTKLQDVVPVTTDTPAPAGYVLVNFVVDTNKATTTDALQYAVNPNADPQVLLKDVPHPTLTAKIGFKLNGWDNQDLEDKAVTANITLTAQFTAYADVIALSDAEPSAPNGYVTIRFTEGTNGSFATDASTTFLVNPEASPKATLSALKAAGLQDPKASLGYAFKGWRIVEAEPATDASATRVRRSAAEGEPDAAPASPENSVVPENSDTIYLSDDSSYELVADTTFEAVYTELKDVFASTEISSAPEGYATVTFKVDADKGTVAENAPTVFYVNPTKAVSVGSLAPSVTPKPDYFYTGWDTKDDTTVTENLTVEAQFVKKNSASYTPEAKEVTIHKGDALDAQDTIANAADLPNDTSFSFDGEIDTTAVGTQEVTVKVTYPDKTEDTVRVTITVKDKQPLTPIVVFPDNIRVKEGDPVIVYVGDDLLTDEYMDKFKEKFENLPDGAKVSFVDGPHTNEDGTSYVRIKVEVDGISKTFKVPVDPRNTTAWAEITPVPAVSVKDGAVEVYVGDDLSTEDYMAKFKDKLENLPDNASVSFVDGPNTAEDGSSSVRIRVTVDGASKIVEIAVTLLTRPVPPAPEPEPEPQPEPAPKPSDDTDTPQDATGSKDSAQDTSDAKANNTKERQVPKTSDSTPTVLTTLLLGVGTVLLAVQKLLTRRSVH